MGSFQVVTQFQKKFSVPVVNLAILLQRLLQNPSQVVGYNVSSFLLSSVVARKIVHPMTASFELA